MTVTFEDLQAEHMALQQRIAELEHANAQLHQRVVECEQLAQASPPVSAQLLESLIATIPLPIFYKDADGVYLGCNEAFACQVLGQPPAAIIGKTVHDLYSADLAVVYAEADQALLDQGGTQIYNAQIRYADETLHTVTFYKSTFTCADGFLCGIVGTILDISEQQRAEEEQRQSKALLQSVLDNLPALVYVRDREYRFVLNNHTYYATTHLSPEQVIGQRDTDLFPPEVVAEWRTQDQQVVESEQVQQFEHSYKSQDGLSAILSIKFPIYDTTGAFTLLGGISVDITAQKQAEADARIFQTLADNAPDSIAVAGLDGTITYVNPTFRTSMCYGDTIIGMSVASVLTDESREKLPGILQQVQEQGAWQGIAYHQRRDGSSFPSQVSVSLITATDGTPYGYGAIIRDITEQMQREEELRENQQRLQFVLEGSNDGAWDWDILNGTAFLSPRYKEILGYAPDDLSDHVETWLRMIHPEDAPQVQETLYAYLEGRVPSYADEYRLLHQSGEWRWVLGRGKVVAHSEAGQPTRMTGTITDITEQKCAEAEREALQHQVIDAQRAAIRELSTPLIPITDTTVVMPLIGTLDSTRAQQVLETLLEGVAQHQASLAILDITGVQVVDTQVADALIRAAQAVKLLGAQVMLTGIQPQIAQTLVHLGIELRGIVTQSTLQAGIMYALTRRNGT